MPFTPIDKSFVPQAARTQMPGQSQSPGTFKPAVPPPAQPQSSGIFSTLGDLGKNLAKGAADIMLQPARFIERTGKAIGTLGMSEEQKRKVDNFWGPGLQETVLGEDYATPGYRDMEEFTGGAIQAGLNLTAPLVGGGALSSLGRAATTGAGFGAAQSLGASMEQGNDAKDVFWDTLAGGALGGLLGGVGYGAGKGVSAVAKKFGKGKPGQAAAGLVDDVAPPPGPDGMPPGAMPDQAMPPVSNRSKAGEYLMGKERLDEMVTQPEAPVGPGRTLRERAAGIDEGTKNVMQTRNPQERMQALTSYDEHISTAKKAALDSRSQTPLELAGAKGGTVLEALKEKMNQVGTQKGEILGRTPNRPVPGVSTLLQEFDDSIKTRFGGQIIEEATETGGKKIKVGPLEGRRLRVGDADLEILTDVRREFANLGDNPTAQVVDDTVDYLQRQLYKAKQNLSKPMDKEVIAFSKSLLSKLNEMQQEVLGDSYKASNAKYRELKQAFEWLNKNMGPAGQRGGSLMKRVFSPSDAGTKQMFEFIRQETGIDLVREATFAKLAMELVGDTRQANLLEQLDLMIPGSKTAMVDRALAFMGKGIKKAADPEKLIRRLIAEGLDEGGDVAAKVLPDAIPVPKAKAGALPANFERATGLSATDTEVERKAFEKILSKERELLDAYKAKHGNVVNTDNFRPFFAEEGYVGSNSAAVQEPSSYLRKKVWAEGLQRPGEDAILYAGGSGSGKTSAIKNIPELAEKTKKAAVILDGNLSSHDSAVKALKQAKEAKKKAPIIYVYRDPAESFVEGVVKRMNDNPEEMGRLVPSKEVAGNHIGSWETVKRLLSEDHSVIFVDNSLGAKNAKVVSFEDLNKKINYPSKEKLTSLFNAEAKKLLEAGKITPEQYQGYIN